jgi:Tfp pilus assembly protein PilN
MMARAAFLIGLDLACDFLGWWIGQLKSPFRRAIPKRQVAEPKREHILEASRAGFRIAGTDETMMPGALPSRLKQFLPPGRGAAKDIRLRLAPDRYLHRVLTARILPTSRRRQMARMDLVSNSPIAEQEVFLFFPARAPGADIGDYVIVRRETIETVMAAIQSAGARLVAIDALMDGQSVTLKAMSPGSAPSRPRGRPVAKAMAALAILALLAAVHALWTFDRKLGLAEQTVLQTIDHLGKEAKAARKTIDAHNQRLADLAAFGEEGRAFGAKVQLLDALSTTLPDSAHLDELEMTADHLRIRGYAVSASPLIALLEAHPAFDDVIFAAPVVPGPDSKTEQFDIQMGVSRP